MSKNELDKALELIDDKVKKVGISRRDALKLAGLSSALALASGTQASANEVKASEAKGKILIIGGGLAGISTAAKLSSTLSNPDITIIEPNKKSVCYQPGYTLIGGGVYSKSDVDYDTKDFLPSGVEMILDSAAQFNPEENSVVLTSGKKLNYDYLIVCAGVSLDFGRIKGLEAIGESYSSIDGSKITSTFGDSGANSIYNIDSSVQTWDQLEKLIEKAKSGKKVKALFTDPNTPLKCGGAPKKIMYLVNSRLEEAGVRDNVELHYFDDSSKYFGVKEYADAIEKQFKVRDFKTHFNHNLVGVDLENKVATFNKTWEEKGEWDEDLEEYDIVKKSVDVNFDFDFIHITPPMKAPDAIGKSAIGSKKGWVPVNQKTLQHVKYPNIFSLGDIAAVKMGKTGGSVRKQYKVVIDNLVAVMEGNKPKAQFDGYTVCPLITGIGTVMLAEFNWTAKPAPSFPLDPTKERYIWWLMKVYLLKPMTQYGMLSGKA